MNCRCFSHASRNATVVVWNTGWEKDVAVYACAECSEEFMRDSRRYRRWVLFPLLRKPHGSAADVRAAIYEGCYTWTDMDGWFAVCCIDDDRSETNDAIKSQYIARLLSGDLKKVLWS